ncbi:hypothetical protein K2Z84_26350 [Candidatus Binatia bacterium]|nr:hypothetical protein [Candidatus Binatia bacterium]
MRGAGHVAVASDGDGFLVAWIAEDGTGLPSIAARRLDADGIPLDAAPRTLATTGDIDDDIPSDEPYSFDGLVVGFDGVSFVVTWHATRTIYQWATEQTVHALRVARGDGRVFGLQLLFAELTNVGFCNAATSGPLAAAALRSGMLLFSVEAFGCANVGPVAAASVRILTEDPDSSGGIAIAGGVGVTGAERVTFLLGSTASAASRRSDALVRWLGVPPEDGGAVRNGLWIVDDAMATPIALGATIDVASDGETYIVLASDPDGVSGTRELRAAPFDTATLAVADDAGVVVASGDHGATTLASFGPGRYVAAHEHEASVVVTALTLHDGGPPTSTDVVALPGAEVVQLGAASAARAALLLVARRDGTTSFTVEGLAVGIR